MVGKLFLFHLISHLLILSVLFYIFCNHKVLSNFKWFDTVLWCFRPYLVCLMWLMLISDALFSLFRKFMCWMFLFSFLFHQWYQGQFHFKASSYEREVQANAILFASIISNGPCFGKVHIIFKDLCSLYYYYYAWTLVHGYICLYFSLHKESFYK